MFTPVKELLKEAVSIGWKNLYVLLIIIVMVLPLVWFISKRISVAMQHLAFDAKQIMSFDFSESPSLHSKITEVDELDNAQSMMKSSLSQFISLINSLAVEKNFDSLLEKITIETFNASKADLVATYLLNENNHDHLLQVKALKYKSEYQVDSELLPVFSIESESEVYELIKSVDCKHLFQNSGNDKHWLKLAEKMNSENLQLSLLPLRNRQSEFMGMVVLGYVKNDSLSVSKQQQSLAFVQAFSEFAAVSLESKQLLKMQEALLEAFIKLIAGAIDAKSPYTGGHCQRVPKITKMLAQAACDSTEPLFKDYQLDEDHWQELHIASWLHDCGKVTTPEYVVDKSTKLETIYDRIHEVRMRFEVLKRDVEIDYWKALAEGGDKASLAEAMKRNLEELDNDFEFVATCNQGGEFMQDEKIDRLNQIAGRCWMRTLNNTSGVSDEEKQRMGEVNNQTLPVEEKLLADKSEHIIPRKSADIITDDNEWGFKLDVPEYKFNKGELHNLSIGRGTLTNEERFIINDHMVQTIKMLEKLPYPSHLKDIPVIAGCHHETMDGKGYPKRLTKDDMPLTARMMAIADIFEALTAPDRPYKKAKSLNESLRIMSFMRNDKHIDSDLFDLFLHSGVYLQYAEQYMHKEQVDKVDINQYLSS
jgi:HD-GYP domain-containing protein (c-di-GMP phosphodiesterase class II)